MVGVVFLNNWGHSPEKILETYKFLTPKHDGVWEDMKIVTDISKAEFYVVLDDIPQDFDFNLLDLNKTIFLQREPEEVKPITFQYETFYRGTYDKTYHMAAWRLKKTFKELLEINPDKKTKSFSTVTSGKANTYGQEKRLELVYKMAKKVKDFDVYGRGLSRWKLLTKYKGELNYNDYCKFEGLSPYKFSLACENSSHKNYFTEKIIDCFLTWTKPIYWGCPNIGEYFPSKSFTTIDLLEKKTEDIVDLIKEELITEIDLDAIHDARQKVLYEYNLVSTVHKIITTRS